MAFIIRVLIISLLFYLIIWVVRGLIQPKAPKGETQESELVSDALTGVYFDKSKAITVTRGGKVYHFMSVENRDAWLRRESH
jgi:hypothetical protein